jgi:D-beta-D-heptose 7-phosphate kinase/D-beta-D-heptose 1-phosphate adenosyltransferase
VVEPIQAVAVVTLYHDPTPLHLIQAVSPDVPFKGAEYTVKTVVGGDYVRS